MLNLDELARHLTNTWGQKTLEELRVEAEREVTGTAFESVRVAGGQRLIIVLCATDLDQIQRLEQAFELVDDGTAEDWNTLTLAAVAIRTFAGLGFSFEGLRDEFGRRSAVVLIAAEPCSIQKMESVFALKP